jgi:hypothetical protein
MFGDRFRPKRSHLPIFLVMLRRISYWLRLSSVLVLSSLFSVLLMVVFMVVLVGQAQARVPNPQHNLRLDQRLLASSCQQAPQGVPCLNSVIYQLDRARALMHLGPYRLPAHFDQFSAAQQLFILADLDRQAYHLQPVQGLNTELDSNAWQGVLDVNDPSTRLALTYASNWAGGYSNALSAYYDWVYADGYHSTNIDCRTRQAAGCWGHRQNIFYPFHGDVLMGSASGFEHHTPGYGMIIISANPGSYPSANVYSWHQAQTVGTGRSFYNPGQPLTINAGNGQVSAAGQRCQRGNEQSNCVIFATGRQQVRAQAPAGQRFSGWSGACQGTGACRVSFTAPAALQAHYQPITH